MRRPPTIHDARAALWTWRAVRSARTQLRAGAVRDVRVPPPPAIPSFAGRAVRRMLADRASCLEQALVLQRWLVANGVERDVIVGTSGSRTGDFVAHAWVDGEFLPEEPAYVEMI